MPTFHVYYDAVIHYSGCMAIEAETAEDAQTTAYLTPPELDGLSPEHVTTFNVSGIAPIASDGSEVFADEDPIDDRCNCGHSEYVHHPGDGHCLDCGCPRLVFGE